jgi:hypothetical protein
MMEKIVHTAKQTVKAIVESHNARAWSPLRTAVRSFMARSRLGLPLKITDRAK